MPKFSLMIFSMAKDLSKKTMNIKDTLQMAANAGIPYVDIMRISQQQTAEYRAAMKETGVSVYCYTAVISFFEKREKISANLDKELQNALTLGAKLFMIVPFYFMVDEMKAKKLDREQVREYMKKGFQLAVEKGQKAGLQVCFETTPQDVLCLSGTEDCKWMLEQVPGLGFVFDTANMLSHGDKTLEAYEALKSHIIHVHLKDVALRERRFSLLPKEHTPDGKVMQATVFGEGVIPVREVFDRMQQSEYSGCFAIEYIHPEGGALTLAQNSTHLKRYMDVLKG